MDGGDVPDSRSPDDVHAPEGSDAPMTTTGGTLAEISVQQVYQPLIGRCYVPATSLQQHQPIMDTIKTFVANATKAPGEEREAYTQDSTTSSKVDSTKPSTSSSSQGDAPKVNKQVESTQSSAKVSGKSGQPTTETYDKEVSSEAPKVHERIHRTEVEEDQDIVDKEHHVNHYKQKIQPIAVKEDDGVTDVQGKVSQTEKAKDLSGHKQTEEQIAKQNSSVTNSSDTAVKHETARKAAEVKESTHHHVHERVQPVIEKDVYQKEVKHNKNFVHEVIQDPDVVEETETLPTVSAEDLKAKIKK